MSYLRTTYFQEAVVASKKDRFVDRLELRMVIPEDATHPHTGDLLPHLCELGMYKIGSGDNDFEYTLADTFKANKPEEKKYFLFRIAMWLGVSLLKGSIGKPLKWKYCKEMVDHLEEMERVYRAVEEIGVRANMTPDQTIKFMEAKVYPAQGKEES